MPESPAPGNHILGHSIFHMCPLWARVVSSLPYLSMVGVLVIQVHFFLVFPEFSSECGLGLSFLSLPVFGAVELPDFSSPCVKSTTHLNILYLVTISMPSAFWVPGGASFCVCLFCEELLVLWAMANNLQNSTVCPGGFSPNRHS